MKKMKFSCIILSVLVFSCFCAFAQTTKIDCVKDCAREIKRITDVPYLPELSGDSIYWNLVVQGKDIVPCLISNLDNTTKTDINIPNWGGVYCVGDIAFSILDEIIHNIPIEDFIQKNKTYPKSEDLTYFSFVSFKKSNRRFLKKEMRNWYKENKDKLEWVVDTTHYGRTSKDWFYPSDQNPAHGYYIVPAKVQNKK